MNYHPSCSHIWSSVSIQGSQCRTDFWRKCANPSCWTWSYVLDLDFRPRPCAGQYVPWPFTKICLWITDKTYQNSCKNNYICSTLSLSHLISDVLYASFNLFIGSQCSLDLLCSIFNNFRAKIFSRPQFFSIIKNGKPNYWAYLQIGSFVSGL